MTQKRLIIRQGQNKRSVRFRNFENDRLCVWILRALDFACLTYFNFWALTMLLGSDYDTFLLPVPYFDDEPIRPPACASLSPLKGEEGDYKEPRV